MIKKKRTTDIISVDEDPFGTPFVLALAVVSGPDRHAMHRIVQAETVVGRSPEADFVLQDALVSDRHISVRVTGNLFSLVDLGSTNGTLLNSQVVTADTRVRLKNFDEIELGRTRILFIANRFRTEPIPSPSYTE
jgi:pSer/pThr/pTyr-binding forkhead associated (FHA) protein